MSSKKNKKPNKKTAVTRNGGIDSLASNQEKNGSTQFGHPILSYRKLVGHEKLLANAIALYQRNSLPHSIIIAGSGSGKSLFAMQLALSMFADQKDMFDMLQHPDMLFISDEYDTYSSGEKKNNKLISIDQITEAFDFLHTTTSLGKNKLLLIDGGENLNSNASNALLKLIEEPVQDFYIIIVTNNIHKLQQTIKSRCAVFLLAPLSLDEFSKGLDANIDKLKEKPSVGEIKACYDLTEGSITQTIMALNYGLGKHIISWHNEPTMAALRSIAMEFMFIDNMLISDVEISKNYNTKLMVIISVLLQMWQKSFCVIAGSDQSYHIMQLLEGYKEANSRLLQIPKYHLDVRAVSLNIILLILRIAATS